MAIAYLPWARGTCGTMACPCQPSTPCSCPSHASLQFGSLKELESRPQTERRKMVRPSLNVHSLRRWNPRPQGSFPPRHSCMTSTQGSQEGPQSSTGFLAFKLLYGQRPHGILDVAKKPWEHQPSPHFSVIEHGEQMHSRDAQP